MQRAPLRCFSVLIPLLFKMPARKPPGWSWQRLCWSLGAPCFMPGPAGSLHPTVIQLHHPADPVLAPPGQRLLRVQSLAAGSCNEISLLPTVPKRYQGVLKALNQILVDYLQGQKFCFSTDPQTSCFIPENVGPMYVFPHEGRRSGTLSFCTGWRKIMKKLQECQGKRNWLDK